jgi:hypothetical protein
VTIVGQRETRPATAPDDAIKDVPRPDPDEAGEALADAIREPDFRTKTMSPSTSERRLQSDELLGPDEGSQE